MHKNVIETNRLILRTVQIDDAESIHSYAGDLSIDMMMFLLNETIDDTKKFVEYAVTQWKTNSPEGREYVVVLDGKVIGGVNLECCPEENTYEI